MARDSLLLVECVEKSLGLRVHGNAVFQRAYKCVCPRTETIDEQ